MKMATMAGITTKNAAFTTSFHVGSMHCYMNILNGVQLPLRSKVLRFTVPLKYISYPSLALAISPFSTAQWGGVQTPLGVSKLSVVELSGKDRRIALDEYSRLVVPF